jgi:hypothetical protein
MCAQSHGEQKSTATAQQSPDRQRAFCPWMGSDQTARVASSDTVANTSRTGCRSMADSSRECATISALSRPSFCVHATAGAIRSSSGRALHMVSASGATQHKAAMQYLRWPVHTQVSMIEGSDTLLEKNNVADRQGSMTHRDVARSNSHMSVPCCTRRRVGCSANACARPVHARLVVISLMRACFWPWRGKGAQH